VEGARPLKPVKLRPNSPAVPRLTIHSTGRSQHRDDGQSAGRRDWISATSLGPVRNSLKSLARILK
jgi:hypothetical protein